ncbi:MAG: hypothetical protein ABSH12_00445 [Endomicrobiales bacterium]|jgi:hypothetical protein
MNNLYGTFFRGLALIAFLCAYPVLYVTAELTAVAGGGSYHASARVLIVTSKKKLSDPLIIRVSNELRKQGHSVTLSSRTSLRGVQAHTYGAIIIINFVDTTKKDKSIEVFADEGVQKKIVLFNAVGDYLSMAHGQTLSQSAAREKIVFDILARTNTVLMLKNQQ